jgi:hypothetical protein
MYPSLAPQRAAIEANMETWRKISVGAYSEYSRAPRRTRSTHESHGRLRCCTPTTYRAHAQCAPVGVPFTATLATVVTLPRLQLCGPLAGAEPFPVSRRQALSHWQAPRCFPLAGAEPFPDEASAQTCLAKIRARKAMAAHGGAHARRATHGPGVPPPVHACARVRVFARVGMFGAHVCACVHAFECVGARKSRFSVDVCINADQENRLAELIAPSAVDAALKIELH